MKNLNFKMAVSGKLNHDAGSLKKNKTKDLQKKDKHMKGKGHKKENPQKKCKGKQNRDKEEKGILRQELWSKLWT